MGWFITGVSDPKSKQPPDKPNNYEKTIGRSSVDNKEYNKDYDKTKWARKFLPKWKIGRPWLSDVPDKGMICTICVDNEPTLQAQGVLQSRKFIDVSVTYKSENISLHEKSKSHCLSISDDDKDNSLMIMYRIMS